MPKTALHFGAGNIGRGFITPILQENGYEVTLVDVDSDLVNKLNTCLLYTSPSPRDRFLSRMPSSA